MVSYAGNDVWGKHGFVGNTWIDSRSVHRNPAVQRAASEWQDELARKHFAQLDRLANFLQRPDVGAISIIAYADANSYEGSASGKVLFVCTLVLFVLHRI